MTLDQIEQALDQGRISALMSHGKWWRVRRNGVTKLWARSPGRFRIPIKAGLRTYGEITESTNWDHFKIDPTE